MPRKKRIPRKPAPTAGIKMPRLKHYRYLINSMLKPKQERDVKLSGSRRALLVMFMAWMDAFDHPEEQKAIMDVLRWTWGSPRSVGAQDLGTNSATAQDNEKCEEVLSAEIKNIFQVALEENNAAIHSTES